MNKMTKAIEVFKNATSRKDFIEKAMEVAGLTKAGASTYYQNIRNKEVNGKSLYEYNKTAKKALIAEEYVPEHRWTVLVNGKVVNSFPTRAKAQSTAKEVGGKWGDMTKA